jgi:hypothetical protein
MPVPADPHATGTFHHTKKNTDPFGSVSGVVQLIECGDQALLASRKSMTLLMSGTI